MSEYQMPSAELGEWVLFYPHHDAEPNIGVVTKVSSRTLTIWVIAPSLGGTEKSSVHHVTDPGVNEFTDWKRFGFWETKPRDPKMAILAEKVAMLERKLEAIDPKKAK